MTTRESSPPRSKRSPKPSAPNRAFVRKDPATWQQSGWTPVPNRLLRDPDLPPNEIWAWMWLASHTEAFEVSGKDLWQANDHIGRDKAYKLLSSLEERGLLLRTYEVDERGIPYMVYDLQPEPVPEEQRTSRPGRDPKPPRKFPKQQFTTDSYPPRNPSTTGADASAPPEPSNSPAAAIIDTGFLTGQETGDDQAKPGNAEVVDNSDLGGVSPDGAVPDGAGEFYKEEKTIQKTTSLPPGTGQDDDRAHGRQPTGRGGSPEAEPAPTRSAAAAGSGRRTDAARKMLNREWVNAGKPTISASDTMALRELVVRCYDAGATGAAVRDELTRSLRNADSISRIWRDRLTRLATETESSHRPSLPPVCGSCEARDERAGAAERVLRDPDPVTGRPQLCPNCHPRKVGAADAARDSARPELPKTA